jgi:hypothetical protein
VTLERRAPLRRTGPPARRTPLAPGVGLGRSGGLKRGKPLPSISARRLADLPSRAQIRAMVFERDGQRCLLAGRRSVPACHGRLTPHHLRKAAQLGPYTMSNLVTLCVHHNEWVETSKGAAPAHLLGLVVRTGETSDIAWERMLRHELVTYDWRGKAA